jgi:hypothetical protein
MIGGRVFAKFVISRSRVQIPPPAPVIGWRRCTFMSKVGFQIQDPVRSNFGDGSKQKKKLLEESFLAG